MLVRMLKKRLRSLIFALPHYLHLQLFLTLISWPILLMQGIPLSGGLIIGNLLFAPLLTLYLSIASLIFFSEICGIPSGPWIFILELLTQFWCWLLNLSHRSWLCYFPQPSLLILILILVITLAIIHLSKITPLKGIAALTILFVGTGLLLKTQYQKEEKRWNIPCFGKELLILHDEKGATLIDESGALGRRVSTPAFASLTLIPILIKAGISSLRALIIPHVSLTLFKAVAVLLEQFPVQALYIPPWQSSSFKNRGWAAWEELLRTAHQTGTSIILVDKGVSIDLVTKTIMLTPYEKSITKNGLTYTSYRISVPLFQQDA